MCGSALEGDKVLRPISPMDFSLGRRPKLGCPLSDSVLSRLRSATTTLRVLLGVSA